MNFKIALVLSAAADKTKQMVSAVAGSVRNASGLVSKIRRKFKIWLVLGAFAILLPVLVLDLMLGGVMSLTDSIKDFFKGQNITYTEDELSEVVNDAGALYEIMSKDAYAPYSEGIFLLDKKTVLRILKKVDAYNQEVSKTHEFTYEYRVERGVVKDLPSMDAFGMLLEKEEEESSEVKEEKPIVSPTPTATTIPYRVEYEEATIHLSRKNMDNGAILNGQEDIFYLRWQPIVVLCNLYIQSHPSEWGEKLEDGTRPQGYYISDEQIEEIIKVYAFDYSYESDVTYDSWRNHWNFFRDHISFSDLEGGKVAYELYETSYLVDEKTKEIERVTQLIPVIAPKAIRNKFVTYQYNYTEYENGFRQLTERTVSISADSLVNELKRLAPQFSYDLFLEALKQLPGTEDLVWYYEDTIFPMADRGVPVNYSTTSKEECPLIGIYVGAKDHTVNGSDQELAEGSLGIRLYPSDGWDGNNISLRPASWIVPVGEVYGIYEIRESAFSSLTSPDNATEEEILTFLKTYPFGETIKSKCPLFENQKTLEETAKCLYDFQQDTGASISGLFGIMIQEGGLKSSLGINAYNFFSITPGKSWQYGTYQIGNSQTFRDYKKKYETEESPYESAAVAALEEQIYWVYENYWKDGQNSYYLMVWKHADTSLEEGLYASIGHSYCPPWLDRSMPFSPESHVNGIYYWENANTSNIGWVNRCANEREKVLSYIKNTK